MLDLQGLLNGYSKEIQMAITKIKYREAEELLNYINDEELEKLFEEYPEIFGTLSNMSEKQQRENAELIERAIDVFVEFLSKPKGLTEDEYEEMTDGEVIDYIASLFSKDKVNIFGVIKLLEDQKQ